MLRHSTIRKIKESILVRSTMPTCPLEISLLPISCSSLFPFFEFGIPLLYYIVILSALVLHSQILALNRGENLKVLSVKLIVDQWLKAYLCKFCEQKWLFRGFSNPLRVKIFRDSFRDSYDRLSTFTLTFSLLRSCSFVSSTRSLVH